MLGPGAPGDPAPRCGPRRHGKSAGREMTTTDKRQTGILAAIIMVATFLLATQAGAQTAPPDFSPTDAMGLFGTETGDPFTSIFLNQLFGEIFPAVNGTKSVTVFSSIISYFNIIVLVVGGMLFFYNLTVGLLQTANEGVVLGRQWSSLWAPLRVIFAVGLLVPVPGLGGYNVAQSGVAYISKGSTSVASFIWTSAAELVISAKIPITAEPPMTEPGTVKGLYKNATCNVIVNSQFVAAAPEGEAPLSVRFLPTVSADGRTTYMSQVIGHSSGRPQMQGICGSFTTPKEPEYIRKTMGEDIVTGEGLPETRRAAIGAAFRSTHEVALAGLMNDMNVMVNGGFAEIRSVGGALPDFSVPISEAILRANATLGAGMDEVITMAVGSDMRGQESRDALLARIKGTCSAGATAEDESDSTVCYGEGWIGAGSWYMLLARMNNELSTLTEARPEVRTGDYMTDIPAGNRDLYVASGGRAGFFSRGVEGRMADAGMASDDEATLMNARYMEAYDRSTAGLAALGMPMSSSDLASLKDSTNSWEIMSAIPGYSAGSQRVVETILSVSSPANWAADPMIGLTTIGKSLVNLAGVLMGVSFAAGGGLLGVTIPSGIATALQIPTAALLFSGVTLAFVLPMTPFIFWIMAVTGYFLLIVEAMIAVNLWALAHMRLDGDGISGSAGHQGWLMLLALALTPVLMVFGFVIGMGIFRVTTALLDIGINQAMAGILGAGPLITLAAILVYSVMIAVVYMMMIERSFSLVSELPGKVLSLMGARADVGADLATARAGAAAGAASAYGIGSRSPIGAYRAGQGLQRLTKRKIQITSSRPLSGG